MDPALFTEPEPEAVEVWPWHLDALRAWGAVCRQWRVAGAGLGGLVWLGLDAAGAQAALDLAEITLGPGVWDEVQAIADGAREALNGG